MPIQAQEAAPTDSLRSYDLAEIVVQSGSQREVTMTTMQRVSLAGIAETDAAGIDRVMRLIPAAHTQTNSRGETLVYLRNAGERQVALFFDGALLNVPWDNRYDLSLIPASVLGGITVAKGVPSVLYGTNVLGGAINMITRQLEAPGVYTEATGRGGQPQAAVVTVTHLGRTARWSYALSGGYADHEGMALPEDADLPFSQRDKDLRTNTDRRLLNLFGQASYQIRSGARVGMSVLHLDAEQGVAPESHLDPREARVRYWRYPSQRTSMLILNASALLGTQGTRLRGAVWGTRFGQTIWQYETEAYEVLTEVQDDLDYTMGTRLTVLHPARSGALRLALNALASAHEQVNTSFADDAAQPGGLQNFRQYIYSFGVEYESDVGEQLDFLLGGSLDGIATPETGDKPVRGPQTNYGVTSGLRYALSDNWSLRASAGRKVRFPTMRELFGEALNRFLVNPDLGAEASLSAELGFVRSGATWSGEVVGFFNRTYDTIDRRNIEVNGQWLRQRVNLEGSRVVGAEAVATARPLRGLRLDGSLTYANAEAFEDGETQKLAEKPEWLGTLTSGYQLSGGFSVMLQGVYTGRAFSPDEENILQPLPTSLVLNARAAYRLTRVRRRVLSAELFARINNLTDEVVLPQLGLPAAGRELVGGVNVAF